MSNFFKVMILGLTAVTLVACQSSGIEEKSMAAAQESPVNVLSEVEPDIIDYPYTDETEQCLGILEKYQEKLTREGMKVYETDYDGNHTCALMECRDGQIQEDAVCKSETELSTEDEFYQEYRGKVWFCELLWHDILGWWHEAEYMPIISRPDSTCLSAQEAANCAGRLASMLNLEEDGPIILICERNWTLNGNRIIWEIDVGVQDEVACSGKRTLSIDAMTSELYTYQNNEEQIKGHLGYTQEIVAEMEKTETVKKKVQQIFDALGGGQQCEELHPLQFYSLDNVAMIYYDGIVSGTIYRVVYYPDTEQIGKIEINSAAEAQKMVKEKEFTAPLAGELNSTQCPELCRYGVDYAAAEGDSVYAVMDGIVTTVGTMAGYGNYVEIEHPDKVIRSLYAHLSGFSVEEGQSITAGQQIGMVGNAGEQNCLHFEFYAYGTRIDPTIINFTTRN